MLSARSQNTYLENTEERRELLSKTRATHGNLLEVVHISTSKMIRVGGLHKRLKTIKTTSTGGKLGRC